MVSAPPGGFVSLVLTTAFDCMSTSKVEKRHPTTPQLFALGWTRFSFRDQCCRCDGSNVIIDI